MYVFTTAFTVVTRFLPGTRLTFPWEAAFLFGLVHRCSSSHCPFFFVKIGKPGKPLYMMYIWQSQRVKSC